MLKKPNRYIPRHTEAEWEAKKQETRDRRSREREYRRDRGFGYSLRIQRLAASLSRAELAHLSRIKKSSLVAYENGITHPSPPRMRKLAKALNIKVSVLLEQPSPEIIEEAAEQAREIKKMKALSGSSDYRRRVEFWTPIIDHVNNHEVSQRIRERREALGWTPAELAKKLGVQLGTVTCYESNYCLPSHKKGPRLAELLKISVKYLYTGIK